MVFERIGLPTAAGSNSLDGDLRKKSIKCILKNLKKLIEQSIQHIFIKGDLNIRCMLQIRSNTIAL